MWHLNEDCFIKSKYSEFPLTSQLYLVVPNQIAFIWGAYLHGRNISGISRKSYSILNTLTHENFVTNPLVSLFIYITNYFCVME